MPKPLKPFPWQPSSLPNSAWSQSQAHSTHDKHHSDSSGSTHANTHTRAQTNPKNSVIKSRESGNHHLRLTCIWQANQPVTVHLTALSPAIRILDDFKSLRTNIKWPIQSSVIEWKRQAHVILMTRNTTLHTEEQWLLALNKSHSSVSSRKTHWTKEKVVPRLSLSACTFHPSSAQPSGPLRS